MMPDISYFIDFFAVTLCRATKKKKPSGRLIFDFSGLVKKQETCVESLQTDFILFIF